MALRFDQGSVRGVERTPQGGLRVAAAITRVGVLTYRDAEGREWRELRPAEEVFAADSLATLRGAPVTDAHPGEMVTTENWARFAKGHVGDDVGPEGDLVTATMVVNDAAAVKAIEARARHDISAGYACEVDPTPGVFRGERYDAVQRRIRYNHAALLPEGAGRAGTEVSLRLDGAAVQVSAAVTPAAGEAQMKTLKIGGREYRLDSEQEIASAQAALDEQAKAAAAALAAQQAQTEALQKGLGDALAQASAAKQEAAAAKAAPAPVTEEQIPAAVLDAAIAKREALRADARRVLGTDADLAGKSPVEIKRAAVAKALPSVKLDALSEPVLDGMFAAVIAGAASARNDALGKVHEAIAGESAKREDSLEQAYADMQKEAIERGRRPLVAAK